MDITVLILAYNAKDTIKRAIMSVYEQKISARIVVVDDGSIDGTAQEVLASDFGNITLLRYSEQAGITVRLNDAFNMIYSGLLCRLDSDDALVPNSLQQLVNNHKPGTFVYGPYLELKNNITKQITPANIFESLACGVLIDVNDIHIAGGYATGNVGIFEEYGLYARLIDIGIEPVYVAGKPVYMYYRRDDSLTANKQCVEESLAMLRDRWGDSIVDQIRSY